MTHVNIKVSDGDLLLLIKALDHYEKAILASSSLAQRQEKQHSLPPRLVTLQLNLLQTLGRESGSTMKSNIRKLCSESLPPPSVSRFKKWLGILNITKRCMKNKLEADSSYRISASFIGVKSKQL